MPGGLRQRLHLGIGLVTMVKTMSSMARKLIFMMNPLAGTAKKEQVRQRIRERTTAAGIDHEFVDTNAEGHYPELEQRIRREGLEEIIAVGGDGTIRQVTAALRHLPVRFGLIPMGSGNGLALTAGIPVQTDKALDLVYKGEYAPIDAFLVNGKYSCMLSGIGFDAQVAHDFAKEKTRGLVTYAKVTIRNYRSARHYPFRVRTDDREFLTDAFFISIANSNQFGNRFTIAPKASLNDGLLDIVVVRKMPGWKRIPAILRQMRTGKPQEDLHQEKDILYFQTSAIDMDNPELAPLHIDGDPFPTSGRFTIDVIPNAFSLIRPTH
jgi:diacylglycerol kinase (ATP)